MVAIATQGLLSLTRNGFIKQGIQFLSICLKLAKQREACLERSSQGSTLEIKRNSSRI